MATFRNIAFVASICVAVLSVAAGRNLTTSERVQGTPLIQPNPFPTGAYLHFVTFGGNPAPAGSVPIAGVPATVVQSSTDTGFVYTVWGRADLNIATINTGSGTSDETRNMVREVGIAGDEAGHIFGNQLGPFTGKEFWNIMPMSFTTNRSWYSSVESQIMCDLQTHTTLTMFVRGDYAPNNDRPFRIFVYIQNGAFSKFWIVAN